MNAPLPPLAAIRVFEAAARHLSFTRAAKELGMTQAAVSYQIKLLEERVGSALFLRLPRQVVLTEAGQRLAPEASRAFDILSEAFASFGQSEAGVLTVNTMHTFAGQWLAPRLGSFQLAHPKLAVRLETTTRLIDFAREEVDIVVRAGHGRWPGLVSTRLLDMPFTLMLSPKLSASIGGVHAPADVLKLPLLEPSDEWWLIWFKRYGLPVEHLATQKSPSMHLQALVAGAAIAGAGAALLEPAYFRSALEDGRLVQPFTDLLDDTTSYWLAYPEARRNAPKIKAFRDWILAEAAKDREAPPGT